MSAITISIPLPSGRAIPGRWFPAEGAAAAILLLPALGIMASFYDPLAMALQKAGLAVLTMEQRGHGDSPLRPSRSSDYGYREALSEDIPALLAWLKTGTGNLPVLLMGHSLGGHYAAISAGRLPEQVAGVILPACGSAWIGAYTGKTRRQLRMLIWLVPVLTRLFGHYPGDRLGFGGREASRLMRDWLQLARHNRYQAEGLDEDLEAGIRRYTGPVLSLRMADDDFAPAAAMAAVTDRFTAARVTQRVLTAADIADRADHFRWARRPDRVVREVTDWLRDAL